MEQGPSMDPVARTPRAWDTNKKKEIKEAYNEALLKTQAEALDIKSTGAGRLLLTLVKDKLEKRIEELIGTDPMALAYTTIIKEMGHKENIARSAMNKLYQRHLENNAHE